MEYVTKLSPHVRAALAEYIIKRKIEERRWDIMKATLSHTPMTKEGARSLNDTIRRLERHFDRVLMELELFKEGKDVTESRYKVVLEAGERSPTLSLD